jgi:hypothetical protein
MQEIIALLLVAFAVGLSIYRIVKLIINTKNGKSVCSCCSHKESCGIDTNNKSCG